jgi:predicted RNase H-like HicB family nuclease
MATGRKTAGDRKRPSAARRAKAAKAAAKEKEPLRIKVIIHEAEEGGYWAEVPALPGCFTEGETLAATLANIREAIEGCLSIDVKHVPLAEGDQVLDIEL